MAIVLPAKFEIEEEGNFAPIDEQVKLFVCKEQSADICFGDGNSLKPGHLSLSGASSRFDAFPRQGLI